MLPSFKSMHGKMSSTVYTYLHICTFLSHTYVVIDKNYLHILLRTVYIYIADMLGQIVWTC